MKKLIVTGSLLLCVWLMVQYPHFMLNPGELIQGHQDLNNKCASCHTPFRGTDSEKCIACHKLSDIGKVTLHPGIQAVQEKILFHEQLKNQECTACHTDHKGINPKSATLLFNHELLSAEIINNCTSCHTQPIDNLHKQLSNACKNCHNTNDWKKDVIFNHDMIASDAKNNCSSCHKTPDDAYHRNFKDNCSKCHGTEKWKPSTFNHSEYFQLDKDHNVECNTCHSSGNFSAYTCYGCHEHSVDKIRQEHVEEGISNFSKCTNCHKSANEHDIRMNNEAGSNVNTGDLNRREKETKKNKGNENQSGKNEHEDD
ncbi:MAG: class III cytochrome C family protein [Bacteroidetes bacterium]|nr:class III cytochrome C family protein [Bacteroidota bacterium]